MSYTVVSNDPRAGRLTGVARHEMQEAQAGANADNKVIEDETNGVWACGRGATDPNITYIVLYNTNNQACYIYPDAAGTGILVSTTKP